MTDAHSTELAIMIMDRQPQPLFYFHNHFDYYRIITGDPGYSNRRSSVLANLVTENSNHRVRKAINDLGLVAGADPGQAQARGRGNAAGPGPSPIA